MDNNFEPDFKLIDSAVLNGDNKLFIHCFPGLPRIAAITVASNETWKILEKAELETEHCCTQHSSPVSIFEVWREEEYDSSEATAVKKEGHLGCHDPKCFEGGDWLAYFFDTWRLWCSKKVKIFISSVSYGTLELYDVKPQTQKDWEKNLKCSAGQEIESS